MPSSENDGRKDVIADINYFAADGTTRLPGIFKKPTYGASTEYARSMTIHDIRPIADNFKLDVNGFQFVKLPAKNRNVKDHETIQQEYYHELEDIARDLYVDFCSVREVSGLIPESSTGASTVHAFNHVIRQTTEAPTGHPHVDYCGIPELLKGTREELRISPQVDRLYGTCSRYCYLNTWRPIKTVQRDPLVLADATTVPASDYQLRARKFPSGVESGNYIMSHGSEQEQHQWYYMYEMSLNDLVVFKGYDTKQDLPGWRCPHTAIVLEGTENLPPRESIECRAVCFWE